MLKYFGAIAFVKFCHICCDVFFYVNYLNSREFGKKNQFECLIAVMVAIILNYSKRQQQTAPTLKVQSVKFTKDVSVTVIYIYKYIELSSYGGC